MIFRPVDRLFSTKAQWVKIIKIVSYPIKIVFLLMYKQEQNLANQKKHKTSNETFFWIFTHYVVCTYFKCDFFDNLYPMCNSRRQNLTKRGNIWYKVALERANFGKTKIRLFCDFYSLCSSSSFSRKVDLQREREINAFSAILQLHKIP